MELGSPTFVPVRDPEMGFEKIVKIAHARGGRYLTLLFLFYFEEKLSYIIVYILANINFCVLKSSHSM